jgi:hypothetical protein
MIFEAAITFYLEDILLMKGKSALFFLIFTDDFFFMMFGG